MAEHAEARMQEELRSVAKLTTKIVVAYVTRNTITPVDLGDLIGAVGHALGAHGRENTEPAAAKPEPAVPVRRSVRDDHLVCLVCGKPQKVLRRHLAVAHELTPEAYREQFGAQGRLPHGRARLLQAALRDGKACGSGAGAVTTPAAAQRGLISGRHQPHRRVEFEVGTDLATVCPVFSRRPRGLT
jgi:predicted transcriptional regulator